MVSFSPTESEIERRKLVVRTILADIEANRTIKLPDFDPLTSKPSEFALLTVGISPNQYNGTVSDFRYQFEGEEDLLHLIVTRIDEGEISAETGQAVASFIFKGVAPALIWLRPGQHSQHFYVGHDELVGTWIQ